jgi:Zn-dependent peptidase ImmA (M78 family)
MKKLPKKFNLNIYGQKTQVSQVRDLPNSVLGVYQRDHGSILICEKQPEDEKEDTLIHETVHAIFSRAGLNQAIGYDIEEVICQQIATTLTENFNFTLKKKK